LATIGLLTIIIPTRDRCDSVTELLESLQRLRGLERIGPEIIVGDNGSADRTWDMLVKQAEQFPVPVKLLRVPRGGKCAVLNEAIRNASGKILAFLDDDVVVDPLWLEGLSKFFETYPGYCVAQGVVRLRSPEAEDPHTRKLLKRYRTIPHLDLGGELMELHHLNGSNFAARREVFNDLGGFDERLGPGASGTSEDVELAQRIVRAGIKIGYVGQAVVYHRIDRSRLTEDYFKSTHKRQGRSRLLMSNPGTARILFDLCRAMLQYGYYCVVPNERDKYRGKGRVYHYLAMLESKYRGSTGQAGETNRA
jgi:GT2 family glycosyltransferase